MFAISFLSLFLSKKNPHQSLLSSLPFHQTSLLSLRNTINCACNDNPTHLYLWAECMALAATRRERDFWVRSGVEKREGGNPRLSWEIITYRRNYHPRHPPQQVINKLWHWLPRSYSITNRTKPLRLLFSFHALSKPGQSVLRQNWTSRRALYCSELSVVGCKVSLPMTRGTTRWPWHVYRPLLLLLLLI